MKKEIIENSLKFLDKMKFKREMQFTSTETVFIYTRDFTENLSVVICQGYHKNTSNPSERTVEISVMGFHELMPQIKTNEQIIKLVNTLNGSI